MSNRRGQTLLEYTVIVIIIAGVFVAMQSYIKRGFQGRWKSATDEMGEQYDPRLVNSSVVQTIVSDSNTYVTMVNGTDNHNNPGQWTNRVDMSHSVEAKTGYTAVGAADGE